MYGLGEEQNRACAKRIVILFYVKEQLVKLCDAISNITE